MSLEEGEKEPMSTEGLPIEEVDIDVLEEIKETYGNEVRARDKCSTINNCDI